MITCRDFECLWAAKASDELPAAVRDHLAGCPRCAAVARADRTADTFLRRMHAGRPPVDAHLAWPAIERALRTQPSRSFRTGWRRPMAWAAGLAGVIVAAVLIRLVMHGWAPAPVMVKGPDVSAPGPMAPSVKGAGHPNPAGSPKPVRADQTLTANHSRPTAPAAGSADSPAASGVLRPVQHEAAGDAGPASTRRRPVLAQGAHHDGKADTGDRDLQFLNEGRQTAARPFMPAPAAPLPTPPPLMEARKPGSAVLDDLLSLNPIRIAGAGDEGLSAAARTIAAEEPGVDPRLQQKIIVHVGWEKLSDLLARMTRATGVTVMARLEIADERVTVWAEGRALMEVMRDIRHLHGYNWSRSKQNGQYVYSLWQDAQSRAAEEAELQRLVLSEQQQFEEEVRKHVRALTAGEATMKRMAQEDPYLIAQMAHPVVRAGYQLFAALTPDQQIQLTRAQTPSRVLNGGGVLEMFPVTGILVPWPSAPQGVWGVHPERNSEMAPTGDVVTLYANEMTPAQRSAVEAILKGAAAELEREGNLEVQQKETGGYFADAKLIKAQAAAAADLTSATVSIFRGGPPNVQGMAVRVDFRSGGNQWWLYSHIANSPSWQRSDGETLRKGVFIGWPGGQEAVDRYLPRKKGLDGPSQDPPAGHRPTQAPPDPILDAPVSVTWELTPSYDSYTLAGEGIVAALYRDCRHPLVLDAWGERLQQPKSGPSQFRWGKRPLRELLERFFPGAQIYTAGGTIFITHPDRLKERLYQVPHAVEAFLDQGKGPVSLDEMAFLARSLSPWQVVNLRLRPAALDQMLPLLDLLRLYGELSPAQRAAFPQGLAYAALTPPQQASFLRFAQQQRPFVEPWRFQEGGLRLTVRAAAPPGPPNGEGPPPDTAVFDVRFQQGDEQTFQLGLYPRYEKWWARPLQDLVGQPFPFPTGGAWRAGTASGVTKPALADPRLRKKAMVVVIAGTGVSPYVGLQPPPEPTAWSRSLAARLAGAGISVVHVTMGSGKDPAAGDGSPGAPFLHLFETDGQPLGRWPQDGISILLQEHPTVLVVGGDEIVRAVFQGDEVWDAAAVERAARGLAAEQPAAPGGTASAAPNSRMP